MVERAPPPVSSSRPSVGASALERVVGVQQSAGHALERRPRQLGAADVRTEPGQDARGARPVGGALAVQVREQGEAAGARSGVRGQGVEAVVVDAQQAGHGVGHLRGVQRADEGQVATGGVGEPGHRPGGVGGGLLAHRVDGARRAERDDHVARPHAEAQRGRHVVARARGDDRGVPGPGVVERSEDLGDDREPVPLAVHDPQQVPAVGALVGRPVARPRRVAAVGRERDRSGAT